LEQVETALGFIGLIWVIAEPEKNQWQAGGSPVNFDAY
jgi:hypothetical protein